MKPKTPKEEGLLDYKKFCDINSALDTALKKQAEEIKKDIQNRIPLEKIWKKYEVF